ncbi:hypothetical protein [Marinobacterium jannaschii]|uniref:hypothetical protein n=1 Tax=Marinobacterium jannaschii TaxID=64970 RepID=UPI0004805257|nr:hypothetical protein [Marinobacterium jannaschii]
MRSIKNVMSTSMGKRLKYTVMLFILSILLTGCPRMAKVDLYNNTGVDVSVNVGGSVTHIPSKTSQTMLFSSESLIVKSKLGEWVYGRNLIPYGGESGPYFDGTLRVQLNSDGQVFVTKEKDQRPMLEFPHQPKGFPIEPNS